MGMCFGVRDAIRLAHRQAATTPVTILGDLVHNEVVLRELRDAGVNLETQLDRVRTPTVMVTAHGASETRLGQIRERGFSVIEATCPLVHYAHRSLQQLVAQGAYPIVIGKAGHVEVIGMTEDLAEVSVILSPEDLHQIPERRLYGVVAQTTQPVDRVNRLVDQLRARFTAAEVRFVDTVCQPTKQRQAAAVSLANQCDVVIVVGGSASNNTRELVETCRRYCDRVHPVQTEHDLQPEWLWGATVVGITAGTSTPESSVRAVELRLNRFAGQMDSAAPSLEDESTVTHERES